MVPGSTLVVAISALAAGAGANSWLMLVAATVGAIVGDGVSFWLGRRYHREILRSWPLNRYPRFIERSIAFSTSALYFSLMVARGIYRERNGWGNQHSARVKYDVGSELDMLEDRYKSRGYQPLFDQLPWKDADVRGLADLEDYARTIEADIAQFRVDLEPLESGKMHLRERIGDGAWVDITQREIDRKKRTIAVDEGILKKIRA